MRTHYDIVLKEKPLDEGLDFEEITGLYNLVDGGQVIPVEFQGEDSAAMGFISLEAADWLDYQYGQETQLEGFVCNILNDMENEAPECEYVFRYDPPFTCREAENFNIWISR